MVDSWHELPIGSELEVELEALAIGANVWNPGYVPQLYVMVPDPCDSASEASDTSCDSDYIQDNHRTQERESKNERERTRIVKKKHALLRLKNLVVQSDLVDNEVKKKRWTEEYSLQQAISLIDNLQKKVVSYGKPSRLTLPLARKVTARGTKKPPNRFLRFSKALRPSFLRILKTYLHPQKTAAELANIQVRINNSVRG